ncbi:MAG: hypothetical protein ING66_04475 [Rhodocyclaceae bacterium]|jgi:hypothetical protein|nr:hypothetical protein [Rhodocyclaceae bacterium]MCE2722360.1 hypothetical protein [Betaproteobacteria bacterium]MCA3018387.1 hypothetical protein [Rhodocyclaceae bacterium]MCA3021722.1 hypothetical protein [Rhodocyclaceae bacterium]MCA3023942.1 hypothetical protein [Rhodocyclaceae bacterium]
MKTTTMNKDNTGSTILLAALILSISAAVFSGMNVQAQAVDASATLTTAVTQTNTNQTLSDSLIITATRLK